MAKPRTPPRNRAAWDDFGMLSGDEDLDTPPRLTRAERTEPPASPLSPLSLNMGKTPTGGPGRQPPRNSNKRARSVDIEEEEEEEEEEDEDEEAGASDEESPDVRQLRHLSSGRPIFKGRLVAGSALAEKVQAKILARHTRRRVGTDLILRTTSDLEGGLRGALERAGGLAGKKALYERSGAEITIDHDQVRASAQVVEVTIGECNNANRSFHQKDSVLLTARVHRAARAAAPTSSAATPLYQKNANDGGCEQTVDKDGAHNCRPLKEYPRDMREAAKQIDRGLDQAVARDCPEARVLVKHRFGNFNKSEHTNKDGKAIVRRSTVARDMVGERPLEVLESTSRHLCQGAHSGKAALSIASTRLALNVEARRVLGESAQYDEGDVAAAVVAMLRKLATGEHESPEYRESLDTEKTAKLVAVADGLRGKSLADVESGVKDFGKLYGGRGYNAEDASKGGNNSNLGKTKNDTVSAASARVAAAEAALAAADTQAATTAARKTLDEETKKRKLVVKAMDDRAAGGKNNNFGLTAGETVAGALAKEEAARADVDAADSDEPAAAAAKQKLHEATEKRKLVETARDDQARGGAASTLYGREKGNDGRSLSSEQGASRRPTDTSAQWMDHTVDEPLQAEAATCSNCEEPRELSGFFYGGGRRRVVVLDHMVGGESGGVRCKKYPKKPRGVFKPTNENVETITKDGLLKAVKREAKRVST